MYSKVNTVALHGVEGLMVDVETDVTQGLPDLAMVGFLSSEVKEARERVRTALRNSDFSLPPRKITVNLSPADIRKEGTAYDLSIAVSLLTAYGILPRESVEGMVFLGELALDAGVRGIRGVLPRVLCAAKAGCHTCFVPWVNRKEASLVSGIRVIGVRRLSEVVDQILDPTLQVPELCRIEEMIHMAALEAKEDFAQIRGQHVMKRAAEIAAAGMHNLLMIGTPGSGKTMIARRIPGILPPISMEESLAVSGVYSVAGMLGEDRPMIVERPFRAPHHTISTPALVGGGRDPRPGEISLADRGVLFLDELPEFRKETLEALRQPVEDRQVTISRIRGSIRYPADTMVVAAMNPCMCGFYPDRGRCSCREDQVRRYLQRISRPLLERMDLCVEASPVTYRELTGEETEESSAEIRRRVEAAHAIQNRRFSCEEIYFNSQMGMKQIEKFCELREEDRLRMEQVFLDKKLSARSYHRVLKVARTIADLDGSEQMEWKHLMEAIRFRSVEERFWG